MKKLFTILCAFLVVNCLSAQTDAGTTMLEGSTNFNYTSVKATKVISWDHGKLGGTY